MPSDVAVIRDHYAAAIRAGYDSAAHRFTGEDALPEEHELEGLRSILATAEHQATQMEHSIVDAPWTRPRIAELLENWIGSAKEGVVDLRDLTNALEPLYGASRALMIARTESAMTYNGAKVAGLRAHGFKMVDWLAAEDACEECQALADSSPMSVEEYEANVGPHPNCSCTCAPAEEELEGEGEEDELEAVAKSWAYALKFIDARKGDVVGHEFHGNQWGGATGVSHETRTALAAAVASNPYIGPGSQREKLVEQAQREQLASYEKEHGAIEEHPGPAAQGPPQVSGEGNQRTRDMYVVNDDKTVANNAAIREGDAPQPWTGKVDAYCKASVCETPGTLYRGAILPPDVVARLQPGAAFHDPAFKSTSDNAGTAKFYAEARAHDLSEKGTIGQHVMFELHVSAGQRLGMMDKTEYVLGRDASVRITGISKTGSGFRVTGDIHG